MKFPENKLPIWIVFLGILSLISPAFAELNTDPAYNRAVNVLRPLEERLAALKMLLDKHGFEEMEDVFLELLFNPREHVLVKRFILQTANRDAKESSDLYLSELFKRRQFDAETRRIALTLLWNERALGVRDLDLLISDVTQELSIREYAVMLLRQPSAEETEAALALLSRLAENPTAEPTLRLQALGSLSSNLSEPTTASLFTRVASARHNPLEMRKLALLNIHHSLDPKAALDVDRKILYDELADVEIRLFALRLIPKTALGGEAVGLRRLEAQTQNLELKREIAERLRAAAEIKT